MTRQTKATKSNSKLKILTLASFLLIASITGLSLLHKDSISALDSDITDLNGITVDSTLDTPDDSITNGPGPDGICDDGGGNCTLRAAIQEANSNPDASTINFAIPGAGVHTILPNSELPQIVEQTTINGYSQPGAQANSAPSPQPFNGTLLIEIDGSDAGNSSVDGLDLGSGSDGTVISGLVINSFAKSAIYMATAPVSDITISGNYIGTDTTGLIARPNLGDGGGSAAVQIDASPISDSVIGGASAASRNVISGNSGIGGVSMGNASSGSVLVQGNYLGLGSDGLTDIGNYQGATLKGSSDVIDNVISGNIGENLYHSGTGAAITGNYIGTDYQGHISNTISQGGGLTVGQSGSGIIVGGTSQDDKNIIAGNNRAGVQINSMYLPFPVTLTPGRVTILGNSIFGNEPLSFAGGVVPGLGIDLFHVELDGSFQPVSIDSEGPTPNDPSDPDSGPNNYINFPVLNSVSVTGAQASINFNLDAADSPSDQYRIEFFANDTADPSGYGEGQTFLGSTTVTNGNNQLATLSLPSNLNLSSKSISATTTAIDNTTNSGFGSTSEFSPIFSNTTVTNPPQNNDNNSNLASTGQNPLLLSLIAITLLGVGMGVVVRHKKS